MNRLSTNTTREIVQRKRKEYLRARKGEKNRILDELNLTGYHRKSLVRLLRGGVPNRKKGVIRRRRASVYQPIQPLLKRLWVMSFYACGKRLNGFIEQVLPLLISFGEISPTAREESLLLQISASTIDRLLANERAVLRIKGRATTKPGTLLRSKIPVWTFAEWDEKEPGFFELDLVGQCGGSGKGEFLYTLNMRDVFLDGYHLER